MSEVKTIFHSNSDRTFTIERVQDVEDILEENKRLQKIAQKSDWGRHIATIPCVILERWINEDGVNYLQLPKQELARLIDRKLKDPDWMFLRTSPKL